MGQMLQQFWTNVDAAEAARTPPVNRVNLGDVFIESLREKRAC